MERSEYRDTARRTVFRRKCAAETAAEQARAVFLTAHPDLQQVERELGEATAAALKASLTGDAAQVASLRARQQSLQVRREELLREAGISDADFVPAYTCKKCSDTGRVNGRVCDCVLTLERQMMARDLGGDVPLEASSFSRFSLDVYPDEPDERGTSPRRRMAKILDRCRQYAADFDPHTSANLLFTGATGLGKTHLSLAIAGEVISRGGYVLYGSAQNLIGLLEREHFGRKEGDTLRRLQQCDLLVLDDLGSEFVTSFVVSAVYDVINTRILAGRPTVISTNLSLREIEERYTERLLSRFVGCFEILEFAGRDVRVLKRLGRA